jgi:hypothetical protein
MRAYYGLAVAAVLGFASLAQATPLDLKLISADVKWAAHLDADALMASKLVQKAREQFFKEHPEAESGLAMMKNLWRFDPRTDLHAVTIYGTQLKKDTGVAIIQAKVDQKFLLDMVKLAPEYKSSKYGDYELHSWLKDGKKPQNAAFFKPDVLVFGNSIDELKAALDVLDGKKPNVTANKGGDWVAKLPPGIIFIAGAHHLGEAELHVESPLSKQADSVALIVGEYQGQFSVHATLNVKQAEVAKQIKAVVDGAIAMASLAKIDDPDALKLIGDVKSSLNDKSVSVEIQAPVDDVWAQLQKEIAKKKAEMKDHGHDRVLERIHKHLQGK